MTQLERVRAVVLAGGWITALEIRKAIKRKFGVPDEGSGLTARIRELRTKGYRVRTRRREGKSGKMVTEYHVRPAQEAPGTLFETRQTIEQMKRGGA